MIVHSLDAGPGAMAGRTLLADEEGTDEDSRPFESDAKLPGTSGVSIVGADAGMSLMLNPLSEVSADANHYRPLKILYGFMRALLDLRERSDKEMAT